MTDRQAVRWLYRVSRMANQRVVQFRVVFSREDVLSFWKRHPEWISYGLKTSR